MKIREIRHFFEELDRRTDRPVQILLTGGAAAILQGVHRATRDIDFEIHFKMRRKGSPKQWELLQKALDETGRATGITPQYDEDIDRWNAIRLPNKKSLPYAVIGKVTIRLLDPGLWAIGKLTRYIGSDIEDLRIVLHAAKTDARTMARLWGAALGMSPSSNTQPLFRRQVDSFFDTYAREIWGPSAKPEVLKRLFIDSAQRAKSKRRRQ